MELSKLLDTFPADLEALIFDMDGTLADTMPMHVRAYQKMGHEMGVHILEEMINRLAGMPSKEVIRTLSMENNWDLDPEHCRYLKNLYYQEELSSGGVVACIPGVFAVLEHFHTRLPIAIGTGSTRVNAEAVLRNMNIYDKVDALVSADDVTYHKPAPDTFLKCAELLNVNPRNCLVFEDGPLGFEAALSASMPVIKLPMYEIEYPLRN